MEGRKPLVYFLDEKAIPILAQELDVFPDDIDWKPKHNTVTQSHFLDHLLATNDVRIAIEIAAKANSMSIKKWLDDRTLHSELAKDRVTIETDSGRQVKQTVIPDSYFFLTDGEFDYHHFLEIDMGTETRKKFARKIKRYLAYYQSGRYEERYLTKAMRVLTITTSRKRLKNLQAVTKDVGGEHEFWFSTFDDVTPETVFSAPIWQVAKYDGEYNLFDERFFG